MREKIRADSVSVDYQRGVVNIQMYGDESEKTGVTVRGPTKPLEDSDMRINVNIGCQDYQDEEAHAITRVSLRRDEARELGSALLDAARTPADVVTAEKS